MVPPEEKSPIGPPIVVSLEEDDHLGPLVTIASEGRGCLVPVPPLVSSSPSFFSKILDIFLAFFLINTVDL
jgi:hypothetical protein